MTNDELAKVITYALIKAGHMHDSKFSAAYRLIKERLSARTGDEAKHGQVPGA